MTGHGNSELFIGNCNGYSEHVCLVWVSFGFLFSENHTRTMSHRWVYVESAKYWMNNRYYHMMTMNRSLFGVWVAMKTGISIFCCCLSSHSVFTFIDINGFCLYFFRHPTKIVRLYTIFHNLSWHSGEHLYGWLADWLSLSIEYLNALHLPSMNRTEDVFSAAIRYHAQRLHAKLALHEWKSWNIFHGVIRQKSARHANNIKGKITSWQRIRWCETDMHIYKYIYKTSKNSI